MTEEFRLSSRRLCLRTPTLANSVALQSIAKDKLVAQTTASIAHPYPDGGAKAFIEHVRSVAGPKRRNLAVQLLSSEEFIGMIGYAGDSDAAELSYMISPNHWGLGYATEAATCLIAHIFEATSFTTMTSSAMIANPASEAVLHKVGFRRERIADVEISLRGGPVRTSFWRLKANEFRGN